jgi:hypothetical protein
MDWRAELWLGHLDIVDAPDVLGGYADFLTIRLGEHSIADMLDSLSQDAGPNMSPNPYKTSVLLPPAYPLKPSRT